MNSVDVQVGGQMDMSGVWSKYNWWTAGYKLKNGKDKLYSKSLVGDYVYEFHVNPDVVTVNEKIATDVNAWQQAFVEGSGEGAATFFNYMKCSSATYDPATGDVQVTFTINENGTGKVSCKTLDTDKTARPNLIQAYSPAGAFTINPENFKKGEYAVQGEADFKGTIDMSPWMAHVFQFALGLILNIRS